MKTNQTKSYKILKITCREFGRGKGTTTKFASLHDALVFIKARWQGAEYMDYSDSFHTDFCTYDLHGFTLNDIGTQGFDGCRTFKFFNPDAMRPFTPDMNLVCLYNDEGEHFWYRATPAFIEEHVNDFLTGAMDGPYTDAEFAAKFGTKFDDSATDGWICRTVLEQHEFDHKGNEQLHMYTCPHCKAIWEEQCRSGFIGEPEEVPF